VGRAPVTGRQACLPVVPATGRISSILPGGVLLLALLVNQCYSRSNNEHRRPRRCRGLPIIMITSNY